MKKKNFPQSAFISFKKDIKLHILSTISECKKRYHRGDKELFLRLYNDFLKGAIDKAFLDFYLRETQKDADEIAKIH